MSRARVISESDWREGGAHEREASREEDLIMDREG